MLAAHNIGACYGPSSQVSFQQACSAPNMEPVAKPPTTAPARLEDRQRMTALIREHTEAGAARLLGINKATLTRILSGLPIRPGTLELARARLAAVKAA